MTPYAGLLFFYLLVLGLLPAVVLGLLGRSLRGYGFCFSLAMLAAVFGVNGQLPALIAYAAWELGLCLLAARLKGRPRPLLPALAGLALLPLLLVKLGEVWEPLGACRLLGVSYMTFRGVELVLDLWEGRVKEPRFRDLAYFLLFFPSVSSGPIDRWKRFSGDIAAPPGRERYRELLSRGVWKLMGGAFSGIVLGGLIQELWLARLPAEGFLPTLSYLYGSSFSRCVNCAGYSSMAVGAGYLLGVQVPENFRQPFLSVDMKDLWGRWHITLSAWLRDFLYSRFVMDCLRKKRFRDPRAASYLGYALTMLAMGAWHGLAPRYLLYGAYHALLLCVNEYLDLRWKALRGWKRRGWGRVLSVLLTFHLFAFGLLIFSGRLI